MSHLLNGISLCSIAWLARSSFLGMHDCLRHNFYVLSANPVEARHPSCSEIPWPVASLLGSFSRKHVFGSFCCLSANVVNRAATEFRRRLAWAWHFRDAPSCRIPKLVKGREVALFEGFAPPQVLAFSNAQLLDMCGP